MVISFKEDLLHYIWKFQKYNFGNLRTTKGERVKIIHPGYHNLDAGPDFLNARIRINNQIWAGSIELHKYSSEWLQHKHQYDPSYENVILHVVFTDNKSISYKNGNPIPTLELEKRIDHSMIENYKNLLFNQEWIPCAKQFSSIPSIIKAFWLQRLTAERLTVKSDKILINLEKMNNDWDQLCYYMIAQYFGLKVNKEAFARMFELTPFDLLLKYQTDLFRLESILFGQAKLVPKLTDDYGANIKREYLFLQKKHHLSHMRMHEWKFSRMRPSNFPTIRIAQLSALIHKNGRLFRQLIDARSTKELRSIFKVQASEYWNQHYRFSKPSNFKIKTMGDSAIDIILINVVVPLLFCYGIKQDNQSLKDKAIDLLQNISFENNKIIRKWKDMKVEIKSAADSQALLHLKKNYCDQYKCLSCAIGSKIMQ